MVLFIFHIKRHIHFLNLPLVLSQEVTLLIHQTLDKGFLIEVLLAKKVTNLQVSWYQKYYTLECSCSSKSNKLTVPVSFGIQSECGKIQTIKTPNTYTFHAVSFRCFQDIKGALSGLRQFLATESPLKLMKNPFHFTFKYHFALKIFKLLPWFFDHVKKRGLF